VLKNENLEEERPMSVVEKLGHVDRRIIFLLIALAVIIPLVFQISFMEHPSPIVQTIFDKIENLPEGSKILLPCDYGPSTAPELEPMATAVLRHCCKKNHKMYVMALWPTGQAQALIVIENVIEGEFPEKVYGTDYVHLGYKAGGYGLINTILADLKKMYTTDAVGTGIDDIPMMSDVQNLRDFDFICNFSAGFPGLKEWVQFAGDPGDIPVAGGTTAVSAPLLYPYYPRQMLGMMGGLKGAAEYEAALLHAYPEYEQVYQRAIAIMGPQAIAHLVIIIFIIIGNITFFIERKRQKKSV
jgi:hypothetical protein